MHTFKQFLINEADAAEDMDQEDAATGNPTQISNEARNILRTGVHRLLRLDHPEKRRDGSLENAEQQNSRVVDAFDMIESLEVIRKFFDESRHSAGMKMRKGDTGYDYIGEIKKDVEEYYLKGASSKEGALNRRKYRALVMLLLDPIVNLFKDVDHDQALEIYDQVVDNTIRYVKNSDVVSNADDAFVQRRLIQKEVQRRNRVAKTVDGIMALRQKSKAKK